MDHALFDLEKNLSRSVSMELWKIKLKKHQRFVIYTSDALLFKKKIKIKVLNSKNDEIYDGSFVMLVNLKHLEFFLLRENI